MYQVLYRKWRPQKFSDVVGQPQVTVTLQNELKAGRIAHAYLFTGSRGTGKTTCAKILAKAVNCLNLQSGDPCGECEICRGIDQGSVMDVIEIDAASNNGVDNIRDLREEANYTPANAKYRVYIIDEVHMLSIGAFNALLKTLEEPPTHVVFILATTEVHKLPATILSRCQRFDFHRITPENIASRLQFVCEEEGAAITEDAALLIARLADGALRDALSLLDQCMGRSKNITAEVVNEAAGIVGREHLFALADAFFQHNSGEALAIVDRLYTMSKDMVRLCEELVSHFRSLMLLKTMKNPQNILAVSEAEYLRLEEQAHNFPLEIILHCLDRLQSCQEAMFHGGNRRIEMETAVVHLCMPELDTSPDALLRRMKDLEMAVRSGNFEQRAVSATTESISLSAVAEKEAQSIPMPSEQNAPRELPSSSDGLPTGNVPSEKSKEEKPVPKNYPQEPIAEAQSGTVTRHSGGEVTVELQCWPEILEELHRISPSLASFMNDSTAYVSGKFVLIDAPNTMAFEVLRHSPAQIEKMRQAISKITGKVYRLGPYKSVSEGENSADENESESGTASHVQEGKNDSLDEQMRLLMKKAIENGVETSQESGGTEQ